MVKGLLGREPALLSAAVDRGGGDRETGPGGASRPGRRDVAGLLPARGARVDIFCAAMPGLPDAVEAFLALRQGLIDARGPHGLGLHFHAQVGGMEARGVLDHRQSVKRVGMKPVPLLGKPAPPPKQPG
jgi:hypothetical protein